MIKNFIDTGMVDGVYIFLVQQWTTMHPVSNDIGGLVYQTSIKTFPFEFRSTNYNGRDSCTIRIDSIKIDHAICGRFGDDPVTLESGDSIVTVDTLLTRTDSTYCWQQQIISRSLKKCGIDSLPDRAYDHFF